MSRLNQALHNDMQALELIRDEIKLHAHLLKTDLQDKWQAMEIEAGKMKSRVDMAVKSTASAEAEAMGAALTSLKQGYEQLRDAIKK